MRRICLYGTRADREEPGRTLYFIAGNPSKQPRALYLAANREYDFFVARRDIIVMGGSAGSIGSLAETLEALPKTLPAAIFVVVHMRGVGKSYLADVLSRKSRLETVQAYDGARIAPGKVFVAPPDRHMLLAEGHIHLSRGPKEGLQRPSINVTFRSASQAYDGRVIGVLFSGMLDDGAAGLWEIVNQHGVSMIQDPAEATFPSMPMNALEHVPINFKLKTQEIAPELVKLVNMDRSSWERGEPVINDIERQEFSGFTCPECRGPLYMSNAYPSEFRCRVGHVFPLETLIDESASTQERKMYEAIVSLEEGADIAEYAAKSEHDGQRRQLLAEARQLRKHATAIRNLIEERQTPSAEK